MYVWVRVHAGVGNKAASQGTDTFVLFSISAIINKADFPKFNFFPFSFVL